MSLEQAIQENTAVLRELIAVMKGAQVATPVVVEETEAKKSADTATAQDSSTAKKTSARASAAKTETPKQEPVATPEPKEEVAPAADEDEGPAATYQDAATAITQLSKVKGRDAAVALLKKFGASKLPEVKPEDFNAIVAEANVQAGA